MHTDRIWRHLRFGMPFSWLSTECVEQVKNVETKSWKVSLRKAGSLTYTYLPGSQHSMSFCVKENQKTQLQNITILKPGRFLHCRPRIWQALVIVNVSDVYVPATAKCLQENLSTSDLLPISNKQMSLKPMHMEVSAFAKKPKLSDNYYFCTRKNEYKWPTENCIFVTSQITVTSASFQSSLFYYPCSYQQSQISQTD